MSPMELLKLIAEAAGTKIYEAKQNAALKTVEKKQAKVEEIHKVCWPTKVIPFFKLFL
jgi:structural maintenance of chromosome 2